MRGNGFSMVGMGVDGLGLGRDREKGTVGWEESVGLGYVHHLSAG